MLTEPSHYGSLAAHRAEQLCSELQLPCIGARIVKEPSQAAVRELTPLIFVSLQPTVRCGCNATTRLALGILCRSCQCSSSEYSAAAPDMGDSLCQHDCAKQKTQNTTVTGSVRHLPDDILGFQLHWARYT